MDRIRRRHGRLHILVNNAGVAHRASVMELSREDWDRVVGTCICLASAASDHVSGACIPVDGGFIASDGIDRG